MKKRISTFLTMFLLVFLLGLNVCAASPVAQIGSKKYSSLEKTFFAVKKGQTITLKKNTTINGGKIVSSSETIMTKGNCKANIILNNGTFQSANGGCIAQMGGTITINGGNYSIKGTWGFVYVYGNCTLNIKGGNIKSQWSLVETYADKSKATISGGTLTTTMSGKSDSGAMLIAFNGKINVTGGKFVAKNKAYAYWKTPDAGSIKVSKNVKMSTPNLWKKTDDICA